LIAPLFSSGYSRFSVRISESPAALKITEHFANGILWRLNLSAPPPFTAITTATPAKTSRSLKAWRPSVCVPPCTSARPARWVCITSSTRSSTTPSTKLLAGYAKKVDVIIHVDNSITVVDDGRGIPVDMMDLADGERMPAAQVVLTKLHAGGKFDASNYKVSGGLHGVGVSCVNALSEELEVEIWRPENRASPRTPTSRAIPRAFPHPSSRKPAPASVAAPRSTSCPTGPSSPPPNTTTTRSPSACARWPSSTRASKSRSPTSAPPTQDRRSPPRRVQIRRRHRRVRQASQPRQGRPARQAHRHGGLRDGVAIDIALQYNDSYSETVFSFANNINTVDGGTHLSGFRAALTRTINYVGQQMGLFKDMKESLSGDDVREGLVAVVSVKLLAAAVRRPDQGQAQLRYRRHRAGLRQRAPRHVS
jgi:hypothetical protein